MNIPTLFHCFLQHQLFLLVICVSCIGLLREYFFSWRPYTLVLVRLQEVHGITTRFVISRILPVRCSILCMVIIPISCLLTVYIGYR